MLDRLRRGPFYRYGVGLAAFAAALAVRAVLAPWFPPGFPYVTFFPAVVVTAYVAGRGPAVFCAALSLMAAWAWFGPPGGFGVNIPTAIGVGFYVFVVAVDIFFIDGMRAALDRLEAERTRSARLAEARDLLAQELHHRVSNNIQVVASLLRLQADAAADPQARRGLAEASQRVDVIAVIQRQLQALEGDAPPFRDLAAQLLSDAAQAAGVSIDLVVEGGEAALSPQQATPVTLVMLECFNNALEHGFGGRGGGRIEVRLDQSGAEHRLTVADDGAGPPADFDLKRTRSLGLRITKAMAAQIDGRFEIVRDGARTVCILAFPGVPA